MISMYQLIDDDGDELGLYESYEEALAEARESELAVLEEKYEYVDSELIADFRPSKEHEQIFRRVWTVMNKLGFCDGIDGQEYKRVYGEWQKDGRSLPRNKFIKETANRPSGEKQDVTG